MINNSIREVKDDLYLATPRFFHRKGNHFLIDLRRTRAQGRCPRPHKAVVAPEQGPGLPMAEGKEFRHRVAPLPFAERKGNPSGKSFPADAGCGHLPCTRVKHELSIDEKLGGAQRSLFRGIHTYFQAGKGHEVRGTRIEEEGRRIKGKGNSRWLMANRLQDAGNSEMEKAERVKKGKK